MTHQSALARKIEMPPAIRLVDNEVITSRLEATQVTEVLNFLAERPLHTVTLMGFIRDNGLVSPLNRGEFYGCRNHDGELEGVELTGHATLIETQTAPALHGS